MKTKLSRRDALAAVVFGGSMIGLRSLATGLPVKMLLSPKKALADMQTAQCTNKAAAQFIILNTSGQGDPFSCNAPGTYDDPTSGVDLSKLTHPNPADGSMTPTKIALGTGMYTAAKPWSVLGPGAGNADVLARMCLCHIMTNTPVHPKEPQVLQLMGATQASEMFPSVLAAQLAPCLGTLQTQPISVGAATPSEALTFQGQSLPTIPPSALSATLTSPAGAITNLQSVRDQALNDMYQWYRDSNTSVAQRTYVDSFVSSQQQLRNIDPSFLSLLANLDNSPASQISAAVALILMRVSPVIAVHIPFGGDNHSDANYAAEVSQHVSGMQTIATLMNALRQNNLYDQVSFLNLNVFGRTMLPGPSDGRQHNQNHHLAMMIGKPFKGGVIGSIAPVDADFGCVNIDSKTGIGSSGGDIAAVDTLAAWGKTVLAGVGVAQATVDAQIDSGTGTAKVIQAALAT